jgi:uncharacterized protein YbjT (DUF2867 family)
MMRKKSLILGATGLIGNELVQLLLHDNTYDQVSVIVRTQIPCDNPKLKQIVLDDFGKMSDYKESFQVDDIFCCLGTTMRKAKSKENFKKVDYEYPLLAAEISKDMGAKRFLLVSATGANPKSSIFYNQVKGEVELAIQQLRLPAFLIFRPSLLLGKRKEFRLGEKTAAGISQMIPFVYKGKLGTYRPIQAESLAKVMHQMAQSFLPGTQIFENDQIQMLAQK